MLPLRFHSGDYQHDVDFGPHGMKDSPSSSAVELLVGVAVVVLVVAEALLVVVEEVLVVELVEVNVVEMEEAEVEVSDMELVVDVVEVDVSDVVVSVVVSVDVVESVVAVVSLAWRISSYPRFPWIWDIPVGSETAHKFPVDIVVAEMHVVSEA